MNIRSSKLSQPQHTHHSPPKQTQCQQYLSCYWPDFNQTWKVHRVPGSTNQQPTTATAMTTKTTKTTTTITKTRTSATAQQHEQQQQQQQHLICSCPNFD